jgi:signal transduction histidine kinase
VLADAAAAEQILCKLVDNACKYASCAQDKRIIITGAVTGAGAQVTVMDFGPGLSAHAAARLFRPFSKSAGDAAASAPGVGLGLSLSRRLARSMGADLECDGGRGKGAAFTLTLPLADGRA